MNSRRPVLASTCAALCCALCLPSVALAGALADFEKQATRPSKPAKPASRPGQPVHEAQVAHRPHPAARSVHDSVCTPGEEASLGEALFWQPVCLLASGMHSATQARLSVAQAQQMAVAPRQPGEADLPVVRVDLAAQHLDNSRIDGGDARVELGYGAFAAQLRYTHYADSSDSREWLDLQQQHLLYRIAPGAGFELDIGVGEASLRGPTGRHQGSSWTLPLHIALSPAVALRLRPAWHDIDGNQIADYDAALVWTQPFQSVQLGYRRLEVHGSQLQGAYLGLAFYY